MEQNLVAEEQDIYTFKREDKVWYVHPPGLPERSWDKQDLCLTEGAHKFLNVLSKGAEKIRLRISVQPLEGAGTLELIEHCEAPRGGAIYLFVPANGETENSLFWIFDLALFVFGDMPDRIYVQRVPVRSKPALQPQDPTG